MYVYVHHKAKSFLNDILPTKYVVSYMLDLNIKT